MKRPHTIKARNTIRNALFHQQTSVAIPESELPLVLPEVEDFTPTGTADPPLAKATAWMQTVVPGTGRWCAGRGFVFLYHSERGAQQRAGWGRAG